MMPSFRKYELRLLSKPFENDENSPATEQTALLIFFDDKDNLIEERSYAHISKKNLSSLHNVHFNNCYFSPETIPLLRDIIQNHKSDKVFSAKNSFFEGSKSLDFSNLDFNAAKIQFSKSTFRADNISFKNTHFTAAEVDFSDSFFNSDLCDFSQTGFQTEKIRFNNSRFSDGEKRFREILIHRANSEFKNISFGKGEAFFTGSDFGTGSVTFKISRFDEGKVDFSNVIFGGEENSFEKVEFGNGDVSFRNAVFKDGKVNFISSVFGAGDKSFVGTNFGDGDVYFKNSKFSDGKLRFRMATFGRGRIDFHFCEFGEGDILFDSVQIENGDLDFRAVDFGRGKVRFKGLMVGDGDIIFENSKLEGELTISDTVFGKGEFNFDEAVYRKGSLYIQNVDFGTGKVSFKRSEFDVLSLQNSQLDNFFDLRLKSCNMLDLSDTVVKDILNIDAQDFSANLKGLNLSGMRLLGRIYLDWKRANVSKLIHSQESGNVIKAEQFRILKENYNVTGQYNYEDEAYVEFKRTEAKAFLEHDLQGGFFDKIWAWSKYGFKRLIFDKMGRYATDPLRVLLTMLVTYLLFTFLYLLIAEFGDIHIISSLFESDDPRVLSNIQKAFYHSSITFLTIGYGDYYPEGIARWISAIEGFVGLFLMSYFTVAFVRKVLR